MNTSLGEIVVKKNECEMNYKIVELSNVGPRFHVDKRYRCVCEFDIEEGDEITCHIIPKQNIILEKGVENGEDLSMMSFYWEDIKLSIGTMGDLQDREYHYDDNGIRLYFKDKTNGIIFYVTWVRMHDREKDDIYTWFAADPSYDK